MSRQNNAERMRNVLFLSSLINKEDLLNNFNCTWSSKKEKVEGDLFMDLQRYSIFIKFGMKDNAADELMVENAVNGRYGDILDKIYIVIHISNYID